MSVIDVYKRVFIVTRSAIINAEVMRVSELYILCLQLKRKSHAYMLQ